MAEIKWAATATLSDPPAGHKRKYSVSTGKQDWDAKRPRIEELYAKHEVPEVRRILEEEGFITSERNIRHHLTAWGNKKYLKLSAKQWRYIARTLQERSLEGKNTKFRLEDGDAILELPSSKIQRTLVRKIERGFVVEESSRYSQLSTGGIVGYTPRNSNLSNGCRFSGSELVRHRPRAVYGRVCNHGESLEARGALIDTDKQNTRGLGAPPSPAFTPYFASSLSPLSLAFLIQPPANGPSMSAQFELNFERLQKLFPDSLLVLRSDVRRGIFCVDCLYFEPYQEPELDLPPLQTSFFSNFRREHLQSQNHIGRVHLRMLGYPEPWEGRRDFVASGSGCGHQNPDARRTEIPSCWAEGGCRWAQFKTVEENMIDVARGNPLVNEDDYNISDLSTLLLPLPDLPNTPPLLPESSGLFEEHATSVDRWLNVGVNGVAEEEYDIGDGDYSSMDKLDPQPKPNSIESLLAIPKTELLETFYVLHGLPSKTSPLSGSEATTESRSVARPLGMVPRPKSGDADAYGELASTAVAASTVDTGV